MSRAAVFVLSLSIILSVAGYSEAKSSIGKITVVSGTVSYKSVDNSDWMKAKKGYQLFEGDKVKTGVRSKALLVFVDGSKMVVSEKSTISINKFLIKGKKKRDVLFGIDRGTVRAFVKKFFGKSTVRVKTKTSTAGVKGTEFVVKTEGDSVMIFGTESEVELTGENGDAVTVGPNMMAQSTLDSEATTPVDIKEDKELSNAKELLDNLTDTDAATNWEEAGKVGDIVARYNINIAKLKIDNKHFDDSINLLHGSIDFATDKNMKAECYNMTALVKSTFKGDLLGALSDYKIIISDYDDTDFLEQALYNAGRISLELGQDGEAEKFFEKYLKLYPSGKFRVTVDVLLDTIK